jgi:uncharacterized protein with PQ loop repeat
MSLDMACRGVQGLGLGILVGATLVKVPQLLSVVRAKSAAGLNPISFELETLGLLIGTAYGFILSLPLTAFGEVVVSVRMPVGVPACMQLCVSLHAAANRKPWVISTEMSPC